MSRDLTAEEIEQYADGEIDSVEVEQHLRECPRCATAVLHTVRMKRAIRDAMTADPIPRFVPRKNRWTWMAVAAAAAVIIIATAVVARRPSAAHELTDMHLTLLASANPVDVISTDRHTVKPWFEGKLPFTVPVPELANTPFHLIGGRVVYWHGNPGAYLLIGKAAHRISLFVFRDDQAPHDSSATLTVESWRSNGLTFIAIAQVPPDDLRQLRSAFQ